MMVGNLQRTLAGIRHMTVRACHATARMNPLIPHLKLRMLRLENTRTGFGMLPVAEIGIIVILLDFFDFQTIGPRIGDDFLFALEVVFDMTLPADKRSHLLPRGVAIRIIIADPLMRSKRLYSVDKTRPGDPKLHRPGIVTVHTAHRMSAVFFQLGMRLLVRHRTKLFKSLHHIAIADPAI